MSPVPLPTPIWANPLSTIIVLTSAKSKLTSPGIVIKSDIPCTPCLKTSSASLKESIKLVFLSTILNNLSFGIVTKVSTLSFKVFIPISAWSNLFLPSNGKGLVTTPTVSIPIDLAISAITGAAPVPVPPPIPAVINTISAPFIDWEISSLLSSAAFLPISGLAPAPNPFVNLSPICIFWDACESIKACLSVFIAINSTFFNPSIIILFTALFPPPPHPITFIWANCCTSTSKSSTIKPPYL